MEDHQSLRNEHVLGCPHDLDLDYSQNEAMERQIREALGDGGKTCIDDFHLWRLGPGHYSSIISLKSEDRCSPEDFKSRLRHIPCLSHVTVEVNREALSPRDRGKPPE